MRSTLSTWIVLGNTIRSSKLRNSYRRAIRSTSTSADIQRLALQEKVSDSGWEEAILKTPTSEWQELHESKDLALRLLHLLNKPSFSSLRRSQIPYGDFFLQIMHPLLNPLSICGTQEIIFFRKVGTHLIVLNQLVYHNEMSLPLLMLWSSKFIFLRHLFHQKMHQCHASSSLFGLSRFVLHLWSSLDATAPPKDKEPIEHKLGVVAQSTG